MAVPTPDEVLKLVRRLAARRRILDLWPDDARAAHLARRMRERSVQPRDLRHALEHATGCEPADDGRWKVRGPDLDEEELVIIVALDGESFVVVFTVHD